MYLFFLKQKLYYTGFFILLSTAFIATGNDNLVGKKIKNNEQRISFLKEQQKIIEREAKQTDDNLWQVKETLKNIAQNKNKAKEKLLSLEAQLKQAQRESVELRKDISNLDESINTKKTDVKQQFAMMYALKKMHQSTHFLDPLFLKNISRNTKFFEQLAIVSTKEIEHFRALKEERQLHFKFHEANLEKIADLKERQMEYYDIIQFDEEQQSSYLTYLKDQSSQKEENLENFSLETVKLEQQIQQWRKDKDNITRLKKEGGYSKGFSKTKNDFIFPVSGREIVQKFRARKDIPFLYKKGILITTDKVERDVKSIMPGRVVFSQIIPGFHHLIIIDHGRSSYSVYGHLSGALVQKDQLVQQGQILGEVMPRANFPRDLFYFEMRYRGRPVNPFDWLSENL